MDFATNMSRLMALPRFGCQLSTSRLASKRRRLRGLNFPLAKSWNAIIKQRGASPHFHDGA